MQRHHGTSPRTRETPDSHITIESSSARTWRATGGHAVDVVVSSRHCEVSDRFREHVEEKLSRLGKHDHRIMRVDVLIEQEARPRDPDRSVRVELTAKSKGPIVRAEACAEDKMAALDLAVDKMAAQMRRAADRRKVHRGQRAPESLGQAMARSQNNNSATTGETGEEHATGEHKVGPVTVTGDGPLVVREKAHAAAPMTLDQALYEMELVGHDFYLFVDKESDKPSVVYRRRGYDYGVISHGGWRRGWSSRTSRCSCRPAWSISPTTTRGQCARTASSRYRATTRSWPSTTSRSSSPPS